MNTPQKTGRRHRYCVPIRRLSKLDGFQVEIDSHRLTCLIETAVRSLKLASIIAPVHSDVEIEAAIIALGREPIGGLVVIPDGFMVAHRAPIISAAARNKVPAVYSASEAARNGGLLSLAFDCCHRRTTEGPSARCGHRSNPSPQVLE
jgi:hypothetical protein